MTERWKAVVGFEGLYDVSSHGRVRSLSRPQRLPEKCGGGVWLRPGRVLKAKRSSHIPPRLMVELYKNGRGAWRSIHVLVLEAFVGPRPAGQHGCHNDGNPANNVKSNLRWGSPKSNKADQVLHGTWARGSAHGCAKINEVGVERLRDIRRSGATISAAAAWVGISRTQAGAILSGKQWRHLS